MKLVNTRMVIVFVVLGAILAALVWLVAESPGLELPPKESSAMIAELPVGSTTPGPANSVARVEEATQTPLRDPVGPVSVSAPSLTLGGVIESMIHSNVRGTDKQTLFSPSDVGKVLKDRAHNPDQKTLSVEQERDLGALISNQNTELLAVLREDGVLTREALLKAVAGGQMETMVRVMPSQTVSHSEAKRLNKERGAIMEQNLGARFGKFLKDWACSSFSTVEPDGVARSTVVYFTIQQEPSLFANRKKAADLMRKQALDLREFFARIPK